MWYTVLKQIFESFDVEKKGCIGVDMIGQILDMLGHQLTAEELQASYFYLLYSWQWLQSVNLQAIVTEIDEDGNGEMSFEEFAQFSARFVVEEEEDTEAILKELKDAFRLYDKEGECNI